MVYFTANPNGEAEVIKVTLEPDLTKRNQPLFLEKDFSEILIKGRNTRGNLLTKKNVKRITLKSHGHSTLGGRKVWFDADVKRLNYDGRGKYLGEFSDDDSVLVMLTGGNYYITDFDLNNHFEDNISLIEKYDPHKVWTAVLLDADNSGYPYLKRFMLEARKTPQNFIGENSESKLLLLTGTPYPNIRVTFGGADSVRPPMEIDAEQFVGVKGFKAKGKRIATWQVDKVEELEPLRQPEKPEDDGDASSDEGNSDEDLDPDAGKSRQQIIDEMTGQLNLFDDKE